MKRVSMLLVLILFGVGLYGQQYRRVSGYLGKRLAIGVGMNISPSTTTQRKTDSEKENNLSLNKAFQATVEYAFTNSMSWGLKGEWIRTSADFDDHYYQGGVHWQDDFRLQTLKYIDGRPDITSTGLGLYVKFFRTSRGAMAPIGTYISFGIEAKYIVSDLSGMVFTTDTKIGYSTHRKMEFELDDPVFKDINPLLYVSIGKALPVGNWVLLDYQVNCGILLNGYDPDVFIAGKHVKLDTYAQQEIKGRMRHLYFMNFSLKLNLML